MLSVSQYQIFNRSQLASAINAYPKRASFDIPSLGLQYDVIQPSYAVRYIIDSAICKNK